MRLTFFLLLFPLLLFGQIQLSEIKPAQNDSMIMISTRKIDGLHYYEERSISEFVKEKYADLIVICGESNSSGVGKNIDVPSELLKIDSSVMVMNPDSGFFEPLNIGVNNIFNSVGSGWEYNHGFELAIKNRYREYLLSSEVYIVKGGQGSSRISNWIPSTKSYYRALIDDRITPALLEIKSKGLIPRITVWWSQGVNDYLDGKNPTTWKDQTEEFFIQLREDLGGVSIVMTKLPNELHKDYDKKIEEIAQEDSLTHFVEKSNFKLQDPSHWSYKGVRDMGVKLLRKTSEIKKKELVGGESDQLYSEGNVYINQVGAVLIKTDLDVPNNSTRRANVLGQINIFDYAEDCISTLNISNYLNEVEGVSQQRASYTTDNSDCDKIIRVGQVDGKLCYIVGDTTTVWGYSSISFSSLTAHRFTGIDIKEKMSISSASIITSFEGISSIVTPRIQGNLNDYIATFINFSPVATGAIVLKTGIPKGANRFVKMEAHVFEKDKQYDISFGCYAASSIVWGQVKSNHDEIVKVTWAYDANNFLVAIIGDLDQVWVYPSLSFELQIESRSQNDFYIHQNLKWTTSQITSMDGYANTYLIQHSPILAPDPPQTGSLIGSDFILSGSNDFTDLSSISSWQATGFNLSPKNSAYRLTVGGSPSGGLSPKLFIDNPASDGGYANPTAIFQGVNEVGLYISPASDRLILGSYKNGVAAPVPLNLYSSNIRFGDNQLTSSNYSFRNSISRVSSGDADESNGFEFYRQSKTRLAFNFRDGGNFAAQFSHKHFSVDNTYYDIVFQPTGGQVGVGLLDALYTFHVGGDVGVDGNTIVSAQAGWDLVGRDASGLGIDASSLASKWTTDLNGNLTQLSSQDVRLLNSKTLSTTDFLGNPIVTVGEDITIKTALQSAATASIILEPHSDSGIKSISTGAEVYTKDGNNEAKLSVNSVDHSYLLYTKASTGTAYSKITGNDGVITYEGAESRLFSSDFSATITISNYLPPAGTWAGTSYIDFKSKSVPYTIQSISTTGIKVNQIVYLTNLTGQNLMVVDNFIAGTSANEINLPAGTVTVLPNDHIVLRYIGSDGFILF